MRKLAFTLGLAALSACSSMQPQSPPPAPTPSPSPSPSPSYNLPTINSIPYSVDVTPEQKEEIQAYARTLLVHLSGIPSRDSRYLLINAIWQNSKYNQAADSYSDLVKRYNGLKGRLSEANTRADYSEHRLNSLNNRLREANTQSRSRSPQKTDTLYIRTTHVRTDTVYVEKPTNVESAGTSVQELPKNRFLLHINNKYFTFPDANAICQLRSPQPLCLKLSDLLNNPYTRPSNLSDMHK